MAEFTQVGATAVQVFVPPPSGIPNLVLFNNSQNPIFVGGSAVTATSGIQIQPNVEVVLPRTNVAVWAICGTGTLGTATTLTAAIASGGTTVTMTGTTGFGTANTLQIGSSYGAETVVVNTIASTVVTFTTGTRFAHASGEAVSLVSAPATGSVQVHRGAV
jgi:hypothetical protein